MKTVSQDLLKKVVHYEPETGVFTKIGGRFHGVVLGSPDAYGYLRILIGSVKFRAHRLAWVYMTGEDAPTLIDHRNRDTSDNTWSNLRLASTAQNMMNSRLSPKNKVGAKGVKLVKSGRFAACIVVNKKYIHLGRHDTVDEAAHAYNKAAIEHFGEFAVINPIGADY